MHFVTYYNILLVNYLVFPENVPRFLKNVFHIPDERQLGLASLLGKSVVFNKYFRNTIKVSSSLDTDQSDLGPSSLQRLSADNTSWHKVSPLYTSQ